MSLNIFGRRGTTITGALTVALAITAPVRAQNAPAADTTAAHSTPAARTEASGTMSILALVSPAVGFVVGHVTGGNNGAFIGFAIGSAIGETIAIVNGRRHNAQATHTGLCFVPGSPGTPDQIIPGTPPTPAIGDIPGSPGTPDIIIPGTPAGPDRWEPCR
ncbi:MAG TPA: hypothetical protein VN706_18160 [Gemmatimonadaceae bacterium]|nr:hypothetical protein [Gemmatimonadaceae bacterium]